MKQHVKERLLIASFVLPALIVAGLYFNALTAPKGHFGFKRRMLSWLPKAGHSFELPFNSYYLAGADSAQLYLGNLLTPLTVTLINLQVQRMFEKTIHCDQPLSSSRARLSVRAGHFYLTAPSEQAIYNGEVLDWKAKKITFQSQKGLVTDEYLATGPTAALFRGLKDKHFIIGKTDGTALSPSICPDFLSAQGDTLFSVDGLMRYDQTNSQFAYLYFYRNTFIYSDASLSNWQYHRTIDTIQNARIVSSRINSTGEMKMSAPAFTSNRQAYLYAGRLYVLSQVQADNDPDETFSRHAVIDIYQLPSANYQGSFYVPDRSGEKLKEFLVSSTHFIARFERHVVLYPFAGQTRKLTDLR